MTNNFELSGVFTLLLLAVLAACGGSAGSGTAAPTIVAITPANGVTGVSRIANITVKVSGRLNEATLNGANVKLT